MAENISRANHEIYVGDNPPTTDQLFHLASQVMDPARALKNNRKMKKHPRTHFNVTESHYYADNMDGEFKDNLTEIRRRLAIRIGRRTVSSVPLREWTMKFYDTYWYKRPNQDWLGIRNRYRFEWVRNVVTLAEHQTAYVPTDDQVPDMSTALDHMRFTNDSASIMGAEIEMSHVSAGDCELLIEDLSRYYQEQLALRTSN